MAPLRRTPHRRRRWTGVAVLGLIAASFGLGGVQSPVGAQAPSDPFEAFGGFTLMGRANGVQVSYNIEDVLPLPPPLLQVSAPEASVSTSSGPSTLAFGSAAYPGNVIGNLPAVIEQGSPGSGAFFPPYPLAARAEHPSGPPEASQDIGTVSTTVAADATGGVAITTMAGGDVPGMIDLGTVTVSGSTGVEDGQVVARSRAEFSSISLLFGLIRLDNVVTDLVATSNGEIAATAGTTTVGGATVLGLPATLGPDGLVLGEVEPPVGPVAPLGEPLGEILGPLGDGLAPVVEPLSELITQVVGGTGTLNELLAESGIHIQVLEPVSVLNGSEATIVGNGVFIDITHEGSGDGPLAQLLALIPSEQLPAEGIPGLPLNTSPQAMVNLLKETHVTSIALGYGTAEVVASPAFSFTAIPPVRPNPGSTSGTTGGGVGSPGTPGSPGFSTPTPSLAAPGTAGQPIGSSGVGIGGAGIAIAVVLALLSSPLWAVGSRNLADNVLGVASTGCPYGLDRPPTNGGT